MIISKMKNYFKTLFKYHKQNFLLYLLLIIVIYIRYLLKLPSPLGIILKPLKIKYWSEGLTTASIQILKLNFKKAYQCNSLIYLFLILIILHIFVEPIIMEKFIKFKRNINI